MCAALLDGLLRRPADFGAVLAEELQAHRRLPLTLTLTLTLATHPSH